MLQRVGEYPEEQDDDPRTALMREAVGDVEPEEVVLDAFDYGSWGIAPRKTKN